MRCDPIACWRFSGPDPWRAEGCGARLEPRAAGVQLLPEGGVRLAEGAWLACDHPALRLAAAQALVLRVRLRRAAKRTGYCEAIAGVWDEQRDARQYALFIAALNAKDRAVAHISAHGGNAPGHDHCRSAAIGTTPIAFSAEHTLEMRWDGTQAELLVDGRRDGEPFPFAGPLHPSAAPFTVGSVPRKRPPEGPGNFFAGDILGIELAAGFA